MRHSLVPLINRGQQALDDARHAGLEEQRFFEPQIFEVRLYSAQLMRRGRSRHFNIAATGKHQRP